MTQYPYLNRAWREPIHVQCSNPQHPAGAYHAATPLPYYRMGVARLLLGRTKAEKRFLRNIKRHGCGCDA